MAVAQLSASPTRLHERHSKTPVCLDNLPTRLHPGLISVWIDGLGLECGTHCPAHTIQTDCVLPADRHVHAQVTSDSNCVCV